MRAVARWVTGADPTVIAVAETDSFMSAGWPPGFGVVDSIEQLGTDVSDRVQLARLDPTNVV
jgi:hypothetical protein